jgi:hypothetical protein
LPSLVAIKGGLRACVATACENITHWNTGRAREACGEVSGLIELAFTEALRVERDRDNGVKFLP